MKKLSFLQLFLLTFTLLVFQKHLAAQVAGKQVPITTPVSLGAPNALLYLPWDYNVSGKKYPLILFGHGIKETTVGSLPNNGLPSTIANNNPPYAIVNGDTIRFIVLSITGQSFLLENTMSDGVKDLIQRGIRIDPNRIYVTGLSAGARSPVGYISHQDMYNYQKVSASVPMSYTLTVNEMNSGIWVGKFSTFAGKGVWAFTGQSDTHTDVATALVDSVNKYSPGNGRLTVYPGGHCCWTTYYDPKYRESINGKMMNIYEWMYQYSLNGQAGNPPNTQPVANAGNNQSLTLPNDSTKLSAAKSYDPDGKISTYQWSQSSGPTKASFNSTSSITPTVSNLSAGTYQFSLKVTDNNDASATAQTQVTVNHPTANKLPVANAGGYQTITLPINTANLSGTASSDSDGEIVSYQWSQYSGPASATFSSTTNVRPTVSNLQAGTYTFDLKVTDNNGGTATARTQVTVKASTTNKLPVANAGGYQTITLPINTTNLTGAFSSDSDGEIVSYQWSQYSGPASATFSSTTNVRPTVSNLQAGTYTFDLKVTDNNGGTATARTQVTVKSAIANKLPVANAGSYQTITRPINTVNLSGASSTDSDGEIVSYQWSQISGPSNADFNSTTSVSPTVSNLLAGTYQFNLKVTDNNGGTAIAVTQVTVKSAILNKLPIGNAGGYQTITLPTDAVKLTAAASFDPDGKVISYQWSQLSGPSSATFNSTTSMTPTVSNLLAGIYLFNVEVTDNNGGTATARTQVTVKAAITNKLPMANAGGYQTITLPTNAVTLTAAASFDSDGKVVSYQWGQFSGPSSATFNSTSLMKPTVSNLSAGTYLFNVKVIDNEGGTAIARTQVTVKAGTSQFELRNIQGPGKLSTIRDSRGPDSISVGNIGPLPENKWINDGLRPEISAISNAPSDTDPFKLTIYPNPVHDILRVTFFKGHDGKISLQVISMSGQVMRTYTYDESKGKLSKTINLDGLASGIYILQLLENNRLKETRKIVKY